MHVIITSQHHPRSILRDLEALKGLRLDLDTHTSVEKDLERFIREKVDALTRRLNFPKGERVDGK